MVAYNFQKQFVEPIRLGSKTHTIRRNSKKRHAVAGDRLQLYTGMRTKSCSKIIDTICRESFPIHIRVHESMIREIHIERYGVVASIDNLELFSTDDGFKDLNHFHKFWLEFHGVGSFYGTLISWGEFCPYRYEGHQ